MEKINSKDFANIVKEEISKFKKEKQKDQFAEKFSQIFVEALEPSEENKHLIKEDVYSFLRKYTSNNDNVLKDKKVLVSEKSLLNLSFGLKLFGQEVERLKLSNDLEASWILEGLNIAEDELNSIFEKKELLETVLDKGFIESSEKQEEEWEIKVLYRIYTSIKHAVEQLDTTQQIKKEQVDGLKSALTSFEEFFRKHSIYENFDSSVPQRMVAPAPKLAKLYVETYAQKTGQKWTNFNVSFYSDENESTRVNFMDEDGRLNSMDVWWVLPTNYGYTSPNAATVPNSPNNAKLYGEW